MRTSTTKFRLAAWGFVAAVPALLAAGAPAANAAPAVTETVLWRFGTVPDGKYPLGGVLLDKSGNLFGTTNTGGSGYNGTVFELSPPSAGQSAWTENLLYSFNTYEADRPTGSLVQDSNGVLYGTATAGQDANGGVFAVAPNGQGGWGESVLCDSNCVQVATGGVAIGPDGALIVPTLGGNNNSVANGFARMLPPSRGPNRTDWTATLVADLSATSYIPNGPPLIGTDNIGYGTAETFNDGTACTGACGAVLQARHVAGGWASEILWQFTGGADGSQPLAGVIRDSAGNLYGTASAGGAGGAGTVFELSPPHHGQHAWTLTTLWSFSGPDGAAPAAALLADSTGALYGTTSYTLTNGTYGCGVVFKLNPPAGGVGSWSKTTLYSFLGYSKQVQDGCYPQASLIADSTGALYGTTKNGGAKSNNGTVFKLIGTGFVP
jgi:uncharacterized repeat protein (TIGR03803 family)